MPSQKRSATLASKTANALRNASNSTQKPSSKQVPKIIPLPSKVTLKVVDKLAKTVGINQVNVTSAAQSTGRKQLSAHVKVEKLDAKSSGRAISTVVGSKASLPAPHSTKQAQMVADGVISYSDALKKSEKERIGKNTLSSAKVSQHHQESKKDPINKKSILKVPENAKKQLDAEFKLACERAGDFQTDKYKESISHSQSINEEFTGPPKFIFHEQIKVIFTNTDILLFDGEKSFEISKENSLVIKLNGVPNILVFPPGHDAIVNENEIIGFHDIFGIRSELNIIVTNVKVMEKVDSAHFIDECDLEVDPIFLKGDDEYEFDFEERSMNLEVDSKDKIEESKESGFNAKQNEILMDFPVYFESDFEEPVFTAVLSKSAKRNAKKKQNRK